MKSFLLIGLGRFGRHIAVKLSEMGHEIMAVDKNEEVVNNIMPYVTNAQIGDSTNEDFMRSLGITNYDVCIVAIGDNFQSSLETTSLVKEMGAKLVVARATRDVHEKFLLRNGADYVVYPEKQLGKWTAIRYSSDRIFDYIDLGKDYSIFEVSVPKNWAGKSIFELNARQLYNINILAMKKDGNMVLATDSRLVLDKDATMLVLGTTSNIQKCFNL